MRVPTVRKQCLLLVVPTFLMTVLLAGCGDEGPGTSEPSPASPAVATKDSVTDSVPSSSPDRGSAVSVPTSTDVVDHDQDPSTTDGEGEPPHPGTPALPAPPVSSLSINFQPAGHAVPAGMLADTGEVFGDRGGGHCYGWNVSHGSRMVASTPPFEGLNEKFWTLTEVLPGSATAWEIALPAGDYEIQLVAGGPLTAGYAQRISVEGVPIVDAVAGDYAPWLSGTRTVSVTDGRLTVQNTTADALNRICFLTIVPRGP